MGTSLEISKALITEGTEIDILRVAREVKAVVKATVSGDDSSVLESDVLEDRMYDEIVARGFEWDVDVCDVA